MVEVDVAKEQTDENLMDQKMCTLNVPSGDKSESEISEEEDEDDGG